MPSRSFRPGSIEAVSAKKKLALWPAFLLLDIGFRVVELLQKGDGRSLCKGKSGHQCFYRLYEYIALKQILASEAVHL